MLNIDIIKELYAFESIHLCVQSFTHRTITQLSNGQCLHFSLIHASDLILVNHDGNVLDESGLAQQ